MVAVYYGHKSAVELLQRKGADHKAVDEAGSTLLHIAASQLHADMVNYLINHGAQIGETDKSGNTALHCAVEKGSSVIASNLIRRIPKIIEIANDKLHTPLHSAILAQKVELVNLLLEKGAKVNAKDETCRTPLHYAIESKKPMIVKALLAHNAKANVADASGKIPLEMVMSMPRSEEASSIALLSELLPYHPYGKEFGAAYPALSKAARDGKLSHATGSCLTRRK